MTSEEEVAGAAPAIAATDVLVLQIAELGLCLDARSAGLRLAAPTGHRKFLKPQTAGAEDPAVPGDLVLQVRNERLPATRIWGDPLCRTEIWELWLDEAGRFVFLAPRASPTCRVVVEPGFTAGEVSGDFSSNDGGSFYPLFQDLEIVLFINWLAGTGDVILHASGVMVDRKGYAFIGPAGAGKSTLAAILSTEHAATVLGEDQIILRYREGCFWIYGTPWHLDPAMCSALKAPLEKLFFLDRSAGQGVETLTSMDGITRLLQTAFIPYYRPKVVSSILDRLALLAGQVPFYSLGYQLGSDVWKLIREA